MDILIRKADTTECVVLTELTFKSKRYWDYPEEYIKLWEEELTVTEDYIKNNIVYVACVKECIAGYYSILENKEDRMSGETLIKKGFWLDNLFILPEFIGHGIGTMLLQHAKNISASIDCRKLNVFSDPHSQGFYQKLGARFVQDCPSSIKGRTIPLMELDIIYEIG